jgi:hypothetical protein
MLLCAQRDPLHNRSHIGELIVGNRESVSGLVLALKPMASRSLSPGSSRFEQMSSFRVIALE